MSRRFVVSRAAAIAALALLAGGPVACGSSSVPPGGPAPASDASTDDSADGSDGDVGVGDAGPCVPRSCAGLGINCGNAPDGCGGVVSCGDCHDGQTCGGDGANRCGTGACMRKSCVQVNASCGVASDGCADVLDCGACATPSTCGGGGKPNHCGCLPKSCAQLGASCGTAPDGCFSEVSCGTCPAGLNCGAGSPNQCGTGTCSPKTCSQLGASCGYVSDGCATALDCGACQAPAVCGGAGLSNQCGCAARSCTQLGANCGPLFDGCITVDCGTCAPPDTCGGGGVAGRCGCECDRSHAVTACLGGTCAIVSCEVGWGNCDGDESNGCETATSQNMSHCGACGSTCALAHAVAKCQGGACLVAQCEDSFTDCDANPSNGCEANTQSDPSHCGACGKACPGPNAICVKGSCGTSNCPAGTGDCDPGVPGCETDLLSAVEHCGFCNNPCGFPNAIPACAGGSCGIAGCQSGFSNCDGTSANGCEINTLADVDHCGGCNQECSAAHISASCAAGSCNGACFPDWDDCDGDKRSNGCETDTGSSTQHCGGCNQACSANHINPSCSGGSCNGGCANGWADCDGDKRGNGCERKLGTLSDCEQCGEQCDGAETCVPGAGCRCGASGLDCVGNDINYCCANDDPGGCFNVTNNAGHCGHDCKTCGDHQGCEGSACTCHVDYGDCDANPNDCETYLPDNANHCGACGNACGWNATCSVGTCTCYGGYGDCNSSWADGCEASFCEDSTCGSCWNDCGMYGGWCAGCGYCESF